MNEFHVNWRRLYNYLLLNNAMLTLYSVDNAPVHDAEINPSSCPSLAMVLIRSYGSHYLISSLLQLFAVGINFLYPQLLR